MDELLHDILETLRRGEELDDRRLGSLVRRRNAGVGDVSKHLSKKRVLPYYLRLKESDPAAWESLDVNEELESRLLKALRAKPRRTSSGVATVTVITRPQPCTGSCIFCPNDLRMPKSYLSDEPACRRAERNFFDPYLQMASRLFTLRQMGHVTDKVEVIILGGSWTDYPHGYRLWFAKELFRALNAGEGERADESRRIRAEYEALGFSAKEELLGSLTSALQERVDSGEIDYRTAWELSYGASAAWGELGRRQTASWDELEAQQRINEGAACRVVGLVVETRPETVDERSLKDIRRLGATKLQMGVQTLDPDILRANGRPLGIEPAQRAFKLARRFGFKIHAHFMCNLLGMDPDADLAAYRRFVSNPHFCPDEVKLYPCALIVGTQLMGCYEAGEWRPYAEGELLELLSACVMATPPWTRISRMVRDFSADDIVAGSKKTNFRQSVDACLEERGLVPQEIRSREIDAADVDASELALDVVEYAVDGTSERFLQWVTPQGKIAGFLRLSLPDAGNVAMIREVHVYGKVAPIGAKDGGAQHAGLGTQLVEEACRMARDAGYEGIKVISAVGTRGYYRRLGFEDAGLYQARAL